MYVTNDRNANFDDLTFDGDESFITRQQIYRVHDDTAEMLNNGSIVDVYENLTKE